MIRALAEGDSASLSDSGHEPSLTLEEQQRNAAAAARRKRRKALVRRSALRSRQKRLKPSQPLFPTEVTKRPLISTAPVMIQPTVQGMQDVATLLAEGHIVALPTECTYEVACHLNWQEPNSWSDRIELLTCTKQQQQVSSSYNQPTSSTPQGTTVTTSGADLCLRPGTAVSFTVSDFGGAESDTSSDPIAQTKTIPKSSVVPHIYVQTLDGPFWRQSLPKRPYAVKSKEGEVLAAHAFNETQHIVHLLAAKVWPGPVVIYVAAERHLPGLTINRQGKEYLALRSLCHPLMVKVYQEYQRKTAKDPDVKPDDDCPALPRSPAGETIILSPTRSVSGGNALLSPGRSGSPALNSETLLIGMTLQESDALFVTKASQVKPDVTVLNGEEPHDTFAVPPCQYGQPCRDSLWLDASRRLVVLQSRSTVPVLTAQQVVQALKNQKAPKSDTDRVIMAVLSKWKVVEEFCENE